MRSEDFELISGLLKERSGLLLPKDKVYLLESRLTPIAHKRGLETLDDLVNEVRLKRKEHLLTELLELIYLRKFSIKPKLVFSHNLKSSAVYLSSC